MITLDNVSHMPHVWNIYLHLLKKWPIHVGKYTIHGSIWVWLTVCKNNIELHIRHTIIIENKCTYPLVVKRGWKYNMEDLSIVSFDDTRLRTRALSPRAYPRNWTPWVKAGRWIASWNMASYTVYK